jgi:hypothetical protein
MLGTSVGEHIIYGRLCLVMGPLVGDGPFKIKKSQFFRDFKTRTGTCVGSSPIGEIRPGRLATTRSRLQPDRVSGPVMACIPSKMAVFWALRRMVGLPSALFRFRSAAHHPCQRGEFSDVAHRQSTCNTIGSLLGGELIIYGSAPAIVELSIIQGRGRSLSISRLTPASPVQRGEFGDVAHRRLATTRSRLPPVMGRLSLHARHFGHSGGWSSS